MLDYLRIRGLRGFATEQTLKLAQPTGASGSGLTVLVGANNAGKSTAIEALRAISQGQTPSFTQGRRNHIAGDEVQITVSFNERSTTLKSIRAGSSETEFTREAGGVDLTNLLVLPSRRVFNPYFGKGDANRRDYMNQMGFPSIRSNAMGEFTNRLFAIEKNRAAFNAVLGKVLEPIPDWSIDQMDSGQFFLKIKAGAASHSSEGLGEGLVSLLYIVDALYDSGPDDLVAIDEPELSLHPALQRRLSSLLLEYAATRQILIATHSPFLVNLDALPNGATVARAHISGSGSVISQLSPETARAVFGLMRNQNNPHILGLNAQEIFFVDDKVILVEGQEDVVFFARALQDLRAELNGTFFGWGVGGAENMERIAMLLWELGFAKVVGILDGNRAELSLSLARIFPTYHFFAIPADDVRTKRAIDAKAPVNGLLDDSNTNVRPEHAEATRSLVARANEYLGVAAST